MARCLMCREPFAICAVTYEVEGGELCEACDATFAEPLRPSLGGAVAFLARGESDAGFVGVPGSATTSYRWPEVDRRQHPANNVRPLIERRGPRSDSYFARLAE